MTKKRILSIDDLVKFCKDRNLVTFDSKKTGYRLSVQVPATFEIQEDAEDLSREGLLKLKVKLFHTGKNRNGSFISEFEANRAKASIANRPVLASIHQLSDGSYDFGSHDVEIIENEDGENEIEYVERQVGSFTEEEPFFEFDEETQKTFLCAYAVIPEQYTRAADIIRKKNGTKVSSEISVGALTYNVKEDALQLGDIFVSGGTLLGKKLDTEEEVEEGMLGARADIVDFSAESNSLVGMLETLNENMQVLNEKLSDFSNKKSLEKGGSSVMFEKLLAEFGKTEADITFEVDGLSDEELKAKFEDEFGSPESEDAGDVNTGEVADSDEAEKVDEGSDSDMNADESTDESEDTGSLAGEDTAADENAAVSEEDPAPSVDEPVSEPEATEDVSDGDTETFAVKTFTAPNGKTFEVSLMEKLCAIEDFVNEVYSEADNDYYSVDVFEENVVMHGWFNRVHFRQSYTYENDQVALTGERVQVFAEYLTKGEQDALNLMRGSYDELKAYKEQHEVEALMEARTKVLERFAEQLKDDEGFAELQKTASTYSVEELELRCNALVGKKAMFNFTKEEPKKTAPILLPFFKENGKQEKASPYGGIFKNNK